MCKELGQSKVALLEIHWLEDSPARQPLVERDGLRFCPVQWAERLFCLLMLSFYRCHRVEVFGLTNIQGARGKRLQSLTGLLGPGRRRERAYGGGGRGNCIYISLHCYHQNDSGIKMGSSESHFNVSLIVWDKVTT